MEILKAKILNMLTNFGRELNYGKVNDKFCIKKTAVVCFSILALMFPACSEKINDQEVIETDEPDVAVVIDTDTGTTNDNNEAATEIDTRYMYTQPENNQQNDNKLVIDATSTSFKKLDADNDGVVRKEEFYDGLYALMDADENNTVDEAEFNEEDRLFITNYNAQLNSFADWDADTNKQISVEELKNKLSSFIDVADGEKLAENLYIVWDTDNDDRIEKLELENVVIRFDQDSN